MLYAIAAALVVTWIVGLLAASALCGLVHILLVVTIGLMVLQIFGGRGAVTSRRRQHPGAAGTPHTYSN